MPNTHAIDTHLLTKAKTMGSHKTKQAALNQALKEYVQHLEQAKILNLFGAIDYDPDYGYKTQRRKQ